MHENQPPRDIHRTIVEFIDSGRPFAVALIIEAEGHTPRKAGVRAIIDAEGKIHGTVGGGIVEAEAQRHGAEACRTGEPLVFEFELQGDDAAEAEPVCGGRMRLLIDPTAAKDRAAYLAAAQALRDRDRGALITTVRRGARLEAATHWVPEKGLALFGDFPGDDAVRSSFEREIVQRFARETPAGEMVEALVDPIIPRPLLVIVGGGHVGQALARQAALVEFDIAVIDDRAEFTAPALFPENTKTICADIAQTLANFSIRPDTYVVIVTRGHRSDAAALTACIHAPAAYIGMIGSRRKAAMLRESLMESGAATEEALARVFSPIGLDIGAVTVPEIAVSILAQLIAVRRKGPAHARIGAMVLQ